jgi:hypothetical protein
MTRPCVTVALLLTCFACGAADDLDFEFPAAKNAAEKYQTGIARISQVYRKEQIRLLKDYDEELAKRSTESMKQGMPEEVERIAAIFDRIRKAMDEANTDGSPVAPIEVGAETVVHACTTTFERAMAKADSEFRRDKTKLLTDYIKTLTTAKKTVAKKNDTAEVDRITVRLDEAERDLQKLTTDPPRGARDVGIAGTDGATSTRVSWGPLRKGRVLKFQYLRGLWTDYPRAVHGSPDDIKLLNENTPRLRLCAVVDGVAKPLGEVPGGTAKRPFLFKSTQDYEEIVFNNYDTSPGNNQGEVVYRISYDY